MKRRDFLSFSMAVPLMSAAAWGATEETAQNPQADEDTEPVTISTGAEVTLKNHLAKEKPTIFVFVRPDSAEDRAFLRPLFVNARGRVGLRRIDLKTGEEPVAKQYEVTQLPTVLVYDRRGRLVVRATEMEPVRQGFLKALSVMRIDWAQPGTPEWEESIRVLGGPPNAGIIRTMSLKPQYMAGINEVAQTAHFKDGFLPRRTKEMIATYVSALNKCKY